MNRNILKKLGAVALSALMTLGVASQGISTVEAFSAHVDYDGKSTAYGSTCGKFRINGRQAWCLEHAKKTPGSQDMNAEIYTSTEAKYANIRKIMYYGWFGYEEWSGLHGKSDNEKNVIMSKALSHAYSGSSISKGIMTDFYNYATSKPDPLHQNNLVFSKHVVNTWYDKNAKTQKSESSRLNGPNKYHITINTQTNRVKVVNETRGWSGQVVDVYGGDTVHYEADAGYTGHAYSGYLQGGFTFAPLIAWNGNSKQQQIGTWLTVDPGVNTFLNADFRAQLGSLKLRKTDTGGKLLDGAVFHVSGNGYDRDITVTNGEITVNELPIGDYTVTEKTAPNGYLVNVAPFKTTVSANQTAETTITDEAPTGKISIKKTDSKGNVQGEASLEGAEYTVYGADGQEVGKITTDKDGNGSLENLVLGTYTVKETKAPEAYDLDWNTYTVELTYKDQNTAIILGNVDSKENVKTGKIEIQKTDTEGNPLKGGEFGIYANADMYIGDTLYKKGQLVVSIKTDDSGVARSDDLPYGSYYVKEISAPTQEAGNSHNFVLSDDTQYVKINGKNKTDTVTFVDKKVTASKTTITGTDEIKGAVMTVTDNGGKVIDTWTSDGNPHSIKGLHEGCEYTLTETTAPKGYVKAESIKFTVSTDKKDQTIVMKDKQFTASKKDASGKNYIEGAKLEVRDDQNRVVDSWTSTKEDHYVSGLEEGKTYRLVEAEAPKGYVKADDIFFTVSNEKKNESVIMKDSKITASKTDITGTKEIKGAVLTVTDNDGKVIDTWTSDGNPHAISGLHEGWEYTLTETTAPKGYVKAESIKFKAESGKDQKLVMKDGQFTAKKTDVSGKNHVEGAKLEVRDEKNNVVDSWTTTKEDHYISGLEEGKTYRLVEAEAPKGYVKASDVSFTVTADMESATVVMKDAKITAKKTDISGTKEVEGAEMIVTDEKGTIVDKWISGKEEHSISGLEAGKKYTLTEKTAPNSFVKAESIEFTAGGDKNQSLVMKDKQYTVSKKDASVKNYVEGAKLEVRDEQDRVVDSWTTTKEDHYVSGLEEGKTYRLVEVEAPKGYVKASDIYFTVSKDKKNETVVMKDAKITASKREITGTKEIEGAKMTVTDDKGTVVDKWTSGKEEHSISGLEEGKRYTLTETTAPKGYVKAESIEFTAGDKDQKLVMKDKQVTITKTEVTGTKEIEGAKMTVKDETGKTVDTWTSTKEEHYVSGLEEGKKYTLIEETAPNGYVKAESIEFTVSKEKKNEAYIMKDKQVTVTKTEVSGTDEVEGAKMTVTDEKGKTVDEWTSTKEEHYVSGLEEGKTYILTETTAPNGYVKAESIEFTVSKDKVNQKVNMLDKQVSVTKTDITGTQEVPGATLTVKDEDGNTVDTWVSGDKEHYVSGLEEGKTYTLIEENAPEGYVRAEEITFTVTNEKIDQEVNMFDAQVKVTKTDALTGDAVKGAEFTVFDKDGNIVDKWTTDGTAHAVSGLDAGKEYILKETKTPEGYMTAPDRTLVVSGEQNMDVEIKEQPVLTDIEVQKVDAQTKNVIKSKDFEFTMYSDAECKNAITTVSADKNAGTATFKDLRYGTYYIKETKAPTGYLLSKEVKKVVVDDKLENVGKTYSFIYQDTPMPTTGVKTGDGTDIQKFTALTGISGIVLLLCVILILRKKKNAQ